jgi:Xaa-Pro aminopeptidase
MASAGVEAAIGFGTPYGAGDVQYLTGFDPQIENVSVVVTEGAVVLLGGVEGETQFADMGQVGEWRLFDLFKTAGQEYEGYRFWSLREVLADLLGHEPAKVGLVSARSVVSAQFMEVISDALGEQGRVVDISNDLSQARYEKSDAELDLFRYASMIASSAIFAMLAVLQPGARELEVAAEADAAIKRLGAYSYGWDTMVLSGPRTNTVIGRASPKRIQKGDITLLGASPRYQGYASTVARTVVTGGATTDQADFLQKGITALQFASSELGAGRPARRVDLAARDYLRQNGLGQYHLYGTGHGIGLTECMEGRTALASSDYELPAGIAIMLDVGIFGHPRFFGARHEDPFMIDRTGTVHRLTAVPLDLYKVLA